MLAFEYFWATGKMDRAAELLEPLLEDKVYARWPSLWRLAASAAERRGMTDQAFRYRERVLTLEYENLPEKYNVESVRGKYREMFDHYEQVAAKAASARKNLPAEFLAQKPPKEFLARVIRVADQWRALDTDPTEACQAAADVFEDLGAADLAWQYLTTPLAARPNEAAPWVSMAKRLQQQSQFDLADRAYASAFEAESTNAGILWDRAQSLMKAGRRGEARKIFRQIAEGDWGPDFRHVQSQAKSQLAP